MWVRGPRHDHLTTQELADTAHRLFARQQNAQHRIIASSRCRCSRLRRTLGASVTANDRGTVRVWGLGCVAVFEHSGGRDFDLPRHSHYSGVIPMVFEHSVPAPVSRMQYRFTNRTLPQFPSKHRPLTTGRHRVIVVRARISSVVISREGRLPERHPAALATPATH